MITGKDRCFQHRLGSCSLSAPARACPHPPVGLALSPLLPFTGKAGGQRTPRPCAPGGGTSIALIPMGENAAKVRESFQKVSVSSGDTVRPVQMAVRAGTWEGCRRTPQPLLSTSCVPKGLCVPRLVGTPTAPQRSRTRPISQGTAAPSSPAPEVTRPDAQGLCDGIASSAPPCSGRPSEPSLEGGACTWLIPKPES